MVYLLFDTLKLYSICNHFTLASMFKFKKLFKAHTFTALSLLLLAASGNANATPANEIKVLLDQGKDRQAYEAGKANSDALGTPLFDFYFGIAALNAGVSGEGVLALERYLLQFPENRSAQFQVARGYYILGEDDRARQEFSNLAVDAKGAERDSINQFLDAIRARESRYKPTASAFVEVGFGLDTNVNSGVVAGQVAGLPAGIVITPGQSGERRADSFGSVIAGLQGVYPVAPGVSLYGGGQVSGRYNAKGNNDVFDQAQLNLQGGVSVLQGRSLFRLGTDYSQISVGGQLYLKLTTLAGEWHYQNDQFNRFGLSLQLTDQSYKNIDVFLDAAKTVKVASGADERDSTLTNLTGSWNRSMAHPFNPELSFAINLGNEKNRKARPDLSRSFFGLRSAVTVRPMPKWTFGAGLNYQNSRHQQEFAPSLATRRDDFLMLDVSAGFAIDRNWQVKGEYQHTNQKSSIGFYTYNRNQLALKLRYDFK